MEFEYYFYRNFYTPEECSHISKIMNKIETDAIDKPAEGVSKTAKVNIGPWPQLKNIFEQLVDAASHINQRHFGFDIYPLTGGDYVNHNVYSENVQGKYDWHKDSILNKPYDLKMTVIANVSTQPYQGGEFELFLNEPVHIEALDQPGTVLFFPSYFLHRVKPVTRGTRESVSIWLHGPNFR